MLQDEKDIELLSPDEKQILLELKKSKSELRERIHEIESKAEKLGKEKKEQDKEVARTKALEIQGSTIFKKWIVLQDKIMSQKAEIAKTVEESKKLEKDILKQYNYTDETHYWDIEIFQYPIDRTPGKIRQNERYRHELYLTKNEIRKDILKEAERRVKYKMLKDLGDPEKTYDMYLHSSRSRCDKKELERYLEKEIKWPHDPDYFL